MEEWMVNMMKLAKIAKLIALVRDKTLSKFNVDWKPLTDFLCETEKTEV